MKTAITAGALLATFLFYSFTGKALEQSVPTPAAESKTLCTGTRGTHTVKWITVDNKFYIVHYNGGHIESSTETTSIQTPQQFNTWCASLNYSSDCL